MQRCPIHHIDADLCTCPPPATEPELQAEALTREIAYHEQKIKELKKQIRELYRKKKLKL